VRVTTFNVRYDEPADGPHAWPHRRDVAIATLRALDSDLIGLQEPTPSQWDDIVAGLPDYSPFGVFRDEWGEAEARGGFFRSARFEPRDGDLFWLSDTPHVAHSVTWPNDWGPRSCAWVRLRDRLQAHELVFASTHLDTHADSWLPSARLLHRELDWIAGDTAIVLVGDFNCLAGSNAHRYLLDEAGFRDAWYEAGHSDERVVTFHGFSGAMKLTPDRASLLAGTNERIDWILIRGRLTCSDADVDYRRAGGVLPSDHYPVTVRLEWTETGK